MLHSEQGFFDLTVTAPEAGLGVMVIDAFGNVVGRCAEDHQQITLSLPRGIYTVRGTRSGIFSEKLVRLDKSQTTEAPVPPVFSAAIIPGAQTTHEYYTFPSWEMSYKPTTHELAWDGPPAAGFFLFARAAKAEHYAQEEQLQFLKLKTLAGKTLSVFGGSETQCSSSGWSAYHTRLSPGLLLLEDQSDLPRQVPLPLLAGWQTQLFLMHHQRLLWEDMRLMLVPLQDLDSRASRSAADTNQADVQAGLDMDLGLLALQNHTPSVAIHLVEPFLANKQKNPLLGLLGAYLMLQRDQEAWEQSRTTPNLNQLRLLLSLLDTLLPDSADVAALQILASTWLEPPQPKPIYSVPLFRCGTETLLRAAAQNPEWIPDGSLLDSVSELLYGDTVWTTWKPFTPAAKSLGFSLASFSPPSSKKPTPPSWVEVALADTLSVTKQRDSQISVDELVKRLGVSPNRVRTAMNQLLNRIAKKPEPSALDKSVVDLFASKQWRYLAEGLGVDPQDPVWDQLESRRAQTPAPQVPSTPHLYARLKNTLSQQAQNPTAKIQANTELAKIFRGDKDKDLQLLRNRLSRQFREFNLNLSDQDVASAETVRDLAKLLLRKISG